jgi:2-dehydro-3-deoxygluconokinase
MSKKVISIGECMVQILQRPDGLYSRDYAGDSQNFIQYLSWLGAKKDIEACYMTVMGEDKFGQEIVTQWKDHGINLDLVMTTNKKNTGLYFADVDESGNRDYTYYRSDAAARLLFDLPESDATIERALEADLIYASAISLMILSDENKDKLISLFAKAQDKGITTAFDTNYRPAGWTSPANAAQWMNKIFQHVDIALPTNDENGAVFGDESDQDTIDRLKGLGIKEVAVKCGDQGALVLSEGKTQRVSAISNIEVIDTTSAGDSFNAGYISGRLSGLSAFDAARQGNTLAAKVIQHRGAFIPKEELPQF